MPFRVRISTIGSRGDVQPLVALAEALRALGHDARLCVPPDFREWIESRGFDVTPIGPEVRTTAKADPSAARPTPEQVRQMIAGTVATQFATIAEAARGCDAILGATALQIAAPSIAEHLGIPYVFAAFCSAVLPSPHHAPPVLALRGETPAAEAANDAELWDADAQRWNATWGDLVDERRAALGLALESDVAARARSIAPSIRHDGAEIAARRLVGDGG